jgi:hypothetical protein
MLPLLLVEQSLTKEERSRQPQADGIRSIAGVRSSFFGIARLLP